MKFKTCISIVVLAGVLTGCSSLTKDNDANKKFVVNAHWVQDTLNQKNLGFRKINRMSPVIYKNSVVAGNAFDGVISYDLDTKNKNWRLNIPFGVEASGTQIKDRLFVGANSGKMYSIDLQSGNMVWMFDSKSELVSEPLLNEGILYFISGSQSLYALDASTGKQLWIHSRQDTSGNMTIRGGSKPSIDNGIIYVGFSDGSLVAVNAKTGTEQWEITLNRNSKFKDIDASPVIDGDFIYINSYDDKVYCLSKDKGEILWSAKFGGISSPVISGDALLVTSSSGQVAALSKKDGTTIWSRQTKHGIFTEPALMEKIIVTGESQGKLLFLNATDGAILGSFEPGRGVFSKPTVYAGQVYFISGEGNIYGVTGRYETRATFDYLR